MWGQMVIPGSWMEMAQKSSNCYHVGLWSIISTQCFQECDHMCEHSLTCHVTLSRKATLKRFRAHAILRTIMTITCLLRWIVFVAALDQREYPFGGALTVVIRLSWTATMFISQLVVSMIAQLLTQSNDAMLRFHSTLGVSWSILGRTQEP
jgi:hypothetical protein